jgi:hypothetical protein
MNGYALIRFDAADAADAERRYGCAYYVSTDRRTLIPATHVGPDRIACINITAGGELINWRVANAAGETLIHSTERNYSRTHAGLIGAIRLAIAAVRRNGAETRVRPGNRGPWGAGAVL